MSSYLQPLYDALRVPILRAWTDVEAGAVWEAEHINTVAWGDLASNLPYAVITASSMMSRPEYGLRNRVYEIQAEIWRVQSVAGPSGRLLPKLEMLRDDFLAHTRLADSGDNFLGQILPDPWRIDWGAELEPNQILARKQLFNVRAGRLSIPVLIGDTL